MFRKFVRILIAIAILPFAAVAIFVLVILALIRGPGFLNGILRKLDLMNRRADKKVTELERKKADLEGEEMLKQWSEERKSQ